MNLKIRDSKGKKEGPGNNIFSQSNVLINGWIEMKISNDYSCSEIIYENLPYGTYEFTLTKPIFLPKGIVCGIFLYEDDKHEYDIEFGRWNKFFNKNLQFVNQSNGDCRRYWDFSSVEKIKITYQKSYIKFKVNNIEETFENHNLTKPNLHINLWIYGKKDKADINLYGTDKG